jgi:hypothetical protein
LGVHPAQGRFFDSEQEQQEPVVVISYRFWQERLGSQQLDKFGARHFLNTSSSRFIFQDAFLQD